MAGDEAFVNEMMSLGNLQREMAGREEEMRVLKGELYFQKERMKEKEGSLKKDQNRIDELKKEVERLSTRDNAGRMTQENLYHSTKRFLEERMSEFKIREEILRDERVRSLNLESDLSSKILALEIEISRITEEKVRFTLECSDLSVYKMQRKGLLIIDEIRKRVSNEGGVAYVIHNKTLINYSRLPSFEELKEKNRLFRVVESCEYTFISHKWFGNKPDDEDDTLLHFIKSLREGFYWVDYCCIAQVDQEAKKEMLRTIPRLISKRVLIFPSNADYQRSVWCAFETIMFPEFNLTLWDELLPVQSREDALFMALCVLSSTEGDMVREKLLRYFDSIF